MKATTVALLLAFASPAYAFHETESFERSANSGGGAGYYYNGSPQYKGYDCSLCHTDPAGKISIEIDSGLTSGVYTPGLGYRVGVRLIGEHRGLDSAFNPNTFVASVAGETGQPLGEMAGSSLVLAMDGGSVAVAEGFGEGEVEWSFTWWSPEEGGPATFYIALLDGDGAGDPDTRWIDPLNDDLALASFSLCPEGQDCPPHATAPEEEKSPTACTASRGDGGWWIVGLFIVSVGCRRQRRKWPTRS